MLRRLLLASAVALSACPGLSLEAGNAYPCDFSQPPSERDKACVAGDVCGIDNRCTRYLYEGPRFEGAPSLVSAGAGAPVHPLVLATPARLVAGDPGGRGPLLVRNDAGVHVVTPRGQLFRGPGIADDVTALTFYVFDGGVYALGLRADIGQGERLVGAAIPLSDPRELRELATLPLADLEVEGAFPPAARARFLRVQPTLPATVQLITPTPERAQRLLGLSNGKLVLADYPVLTDAGLPGAVDVTMVDRRGARPAAVVLLRSSLQLERPDGGFQVVDAFSPPATEGSLRVNTASSVLAALRNRSTLSTWQVSTSAEPAQELQQAWPDCTPCSSLTGAIAAAPVPPAEGVAVEVLCADPVGTENRLSIVRVTGSQAVENTDRCQGEVLPLPLDERELPALLGRLVTTGEQRAVNVAGRSGQLWRGETFSSLLPVALDRVPTDVTSMRTTTDVGDVVTLAAITDRYLAQQQVPAGQVLNGFRRIDFSQEFGAPDLPPLAAAIHGVPGWGVLKNGVVVRFKADERDSLLTRGKLEFGPRLVSPAGDPVRATLGGEAFVEVDGGVTSFFVAADDGLYFVPSPPGTLSTAATGSSTMTPQLQPEPSVPIRSFALERTPLGTDGKTKARGYLVTSRNVFEWSLGGTPARWSATPLLLAGGEPAEVWFDKPRSALGRVGYTNGQIFTLPGGYQLSETLPALADGGVVRVLDYENLGGWPVALASSGLFKADWPLVDGKLENKFDDGRPNKPMRWEELTLPDGGRPWVRGETVRAGKLFVTLETQPDGRQLFTLYVFLADGVWTVATHLRKP
jgi:hypothetical protein